MAEMTILRSTFRLLLLLTVLVLAAVGSKNEQASLEDSSGFATPRSTNDNAIIMTATREDESEKSSPIVHVAENVSVKNVSWDNEEDEDGEKEKQEDEEEDEEDDDDDDDDDDDEDEGKTNENGDEVDEYEDELRGIAESHEAMSRDERKTGISSTTSSANLVSVNRSFVERLVGTRNFDSRENVDEIISDESSVSNEALPNDDDDEVAELLRYKQKATSLFKGEKVVDGVSKVGTKVKRVPTVKKELSTQKEIISSNETQLTLPKTLISNVEIVNRLDDETRNERRFGVPVTSRDPNRYELVRDDTSLEEEYSDVETPGDILRKLDKRQPSELNILKSFLDGHSSEREQRRKLRELGIQEGALAESLIELFTRLADDPRIHQILEDTERDLSFSHESLLDPQKRAHSPDSLAQISLTDSTIETPDDLSTTTKKPKKKKKKRRKKKPRHRSTSTTSTKIPTTTRSSSKITTSPAPSALTTMSSNWPATTQPQWRLVAERLFGSPWSDDRHESSSDTTKIRSVKDRLASINEKQHDSLKALNGERQALMLQSAREYSQPRRLHYGKVNTHEKGSPSSSHDVTAKNYDSEMESQALDYDLSDRSYRRPISLDRYDRYGQYGLQRIRNYDVNPVEQQQQQQQQQQDNDYDEIFRVSENIANHRPFARTRQFRPLGREYASTKTWQDSRYDYPRSWNDKSRTNFDDIPRSSVNWPWRTSPSDYKIWIPRYRAWSRDRNYWQRLGNVEGELDEIESDENNEDDPRPRNWQRKQQERQNWPSPYNDDSTRWQNIDRNIDIPSWQVHERPKSYNREIIPMSLEKSKNRSELSNKETIVKSTIKDKPIVPKITMKTWNSLTSDPATWPFKLTGAKPWPKDKNGQSYNPNAELVRKLGLDKQQDHLLSSSKDSIIGKEILPQDSPKYKMKENSAHPNDERNEIGTIVNSAKSSISWPDKLGAVNEWRSGEKSRELNDEHSPQRNDIGEIWQANGAESDRKIWPGKSPISPKISSVGAWVMPADQSTWRPYDLKHTAYGQLSAVPSVRWNDPTNSEVTNARSWSTKNEQMSASWPQKINNNWNVGDSVYSPDKTVANGHSSTWPSKWRQFAYHKVTAAPMTKLGSSNIVDPSNRPRNSYIAVSAVSPMKYPNNEWRKNDIEETQLDRSAGDNRAMNFDQDDPSSQLRKSLGNTNERWNEQTRIGDDGVNDRQRNRNDPLEHQLDELRQAPYWNHEQMREHSQKRSNSSGVPSMTATTQSSRVPSNSSIIENKSLKNHEGISTVTTIHAQEKKNETK